MDYKPIYFKARRNRSKGEGYIIEYLEIKPYLTYENFIPYLNLVLILFDATLINIDMTDGITYNIYERYYLRDHKL